MKKTRPKAGLLLAAQLYLGQLRVPPPAARLRLVSVGERTASSRPSTVTRPSVSRSVPRLPAPILVPGRLHQPRSRWHNRLLDRHAKQRVLRRPLRRRRRRLLRHDPLTLPDRPTYPVPRTRDYGATESDLRAGCPQRRSSDAKGRWSQHRRLRPDPRRTPSLPRDGRRTDCASEARRDVRGKRRPSGVRRASDSLLRPNARTLGWASVRE
jgi:hypothetical protein